MYCSVLTAGAFPKQYTEHGRLVAMRKLSAYARKARRTQKTYNGAEWLNVITKCRQYDDELLPGAIAQEPSLEAALKAINGVRTAFEAIKAGEGSESAWDRLAHATGITKIRSIQIAGEGNEMLPPLNEADAVLMKVKNRYIKWAKWEVLPQEVDAITYALELYEMVVTSSSPAQMSSAVKVRDEILREKKCLTAGSIALVATLTNHSLILCVTHREKVASETFASPVRTDKQEAEGSE